MSTESADDVIDVHIRKILEQVYSLLSASSNPFHSSERSHERRAELIRALSSSQERINTLADDVEANNVKVYRLARQNYILLILSIILALSVRRKFIFIIPVVFTIR